MKVSRDTGRRGKETGRGNVRGSVRGSVRGRVWGRFWWSVLVLWGALLWAPRGPLGVNPLGRSLVVCGFEEDIGLEEDIGIGEWQFSNWSFEDHRCESEQECQERFEPLTNYNYGLHSDSLEPLFDILDDLADSCVGCIVQFMATYYIPANSLLYSQDSELPESELPESEYLEPDQSRAVGGECENMIPFAVPTLNGKSKKAMIGDVVAIVLTNTARCGTVTMYQAKGNSVSSICNREVTAVPTSTTTGFTDHEAYPCSISWFASDDYTPAQENLLKKFSQAYIDVSSCSLPNEISLVGVTFLGKLNATSIRLSSPLTLITLLSILLLCSQPS